MKFGYGTGGIDIFNDYTYKAVLRCIFNQAGGVSGDGTYLYTPGNSSSANFVMGLNPTDAILPNNLSIGGLLTTGGISAKENIALYPTTNTWGGTSIYFFRDTRGTGGNKVWGIGQNLAGGGGDSFSVYSDTLGANVLHMGNNGDATFKGAVSGSRFRVVSANTTNVGMIVGTAENTGNSAVMYYTSAGSNHIDNSLNFGFYDYSPPALAIYRDRVVVAGNTDTGSLSVNQINFKGGSNTGSSYIKRSGDDAIIHVSDIAHRFYVSSLGTPKFTVYGGGGELYGDLAVTGTVKPWAIGFSSGGGSSSTGMAMLGDNLMSYDTTWAHTFKIQGVAKFNVISAGATVYGTLTTDIGLVNNYLTITSPITAPLVVNSSYIHGASVGVNATSQGVSSFNHYQNTYDGVSVYMGMDGDGLYGGGSAVGSAVIGTSIDRPVKLYCNNAEAARFTNAGMTLRSGSIMRRYVEGTFSPQIDGGANFADIFTGGYYTRVGNLVHLFFSISFSCQATDIGSGGCFIVSNLPYHFSTTPGYMNSDEGPMFLAGRGNINAATLPYYFKFGKGLSNKGAYNIYNTVHFYATGMSPITPSNLGTWYFDQRLSGSFTYYTSDVS